MTKRLRPARRSPLALRALAALFAAAPAAAAPADPDVPALRVLASRFAADHAADRSTARARLFSSPDPLATRLHADPALLLMRVGPGGIPAYRELDNRDAAASIATDVVQPGGAAGLALDGAATPVGQLGVWDGGAVRVTHRELAGRAVQRDAPSASSGHATHVAGTMVAGGVDPSARGMAPAAPLDCWDWEADLAEMAAAAAAGLRVSNHSYSPVAGWRMALGQWYWHGDPSISATEDWAFGYYDDEARDLDQLAFDAPGYLIVASAGNNRADYGPGSGGEHGVWDGTQWIPSTDTREPDGGPDGYDSLPRSKNAKNTLVVGAVDDLPAGWAGPASVSMTHFSGFGPTDDGRIKPDLVANGVGLWSCSDRNDSSHAVSSGTSMASPSVAGSVNLLVDHWRATHGADPRAATLKAILFQTADDAGDAPGPDYRFGWGLMNTAAAAALITADAAAKGGQRVAEAVLLPAVADSWELVLADTSDVRVTLHWTDRPGVPAAPALDPPDAMLVHDLDLRLGDGAIEREPWVLDPSDPAAPATRGDNTRDNTEQIVATALPPGRYTLTVSHKGSLGEAQAYSLAASHPMMLLGPPLAAAPASASPGPLGLHAAPSPFAQRTAVVFTLPAPAPVDAVVFDVQGRLVRTLIARRTLPAGPQRLEWDGRRADGREAGSGVYFVRVEAGTARTVTKVVRAR